MRRAVLVILALADTAWMVVYSVRADAGLMAVTAISLLACGLLWDERP